MAHHDGMERVARRDYCFGSGVKEASPKGDTGVKLKQREGTRLAKIWLISRTRSGPNVKIEV